MLCPFKLDLLARSAAIFLRHWVRPENWPPSETCSAISAYLSHEDCDRATTMRRLYAGAGSGLPRRLPRICASFLAPHLYVLLSWSLIQIFGCSPIIGSPWEFLRAPMHPSLKKGRAAGQHHHYHILK